MQVPVLKRIKKKKRGKLKLDGQPDGQTDAVESFSLLW